jgi:hypothetical protein
MSRRYPDQVRAGFGPGGDSGPLLRCLQCGEILGNKQRNCADNLCDEACRVRYLVATGQLTPAQAIAYVRERLLCSV